MGIPHIPTDNFLQEMDVNLLKYMDILSAKGFTSTRSLYHLKESDVPGM